MSQFVQVHVAWLEGDSSVGLQGTQTAQDGLQDVKIVRRNMSTHQDVSCPHHLVSLVCTGAVQVHVAWLDGGTTVLAFMGTQRGQDGLHDVKFLRQNTNMHQNVFC